MRKSKQPARPLTSAPLTRSPANSPQPAPHPLVESAALITEGLGIFLLALASPVILVAWLTIELWPVWLVVALVYLANR